MGAGHDHGSIQERGTKAVAIALGITIVFVVTQIVGGWIADSLALMADAAHMATDALSFCLSLFAFWIAKRPASDRMTYGYYRAEILGALFSGLALWAICAFLIFEAIRRLAAPSEVEGGIVFIIASTTLCFNLITMRVLHRSSKESLNVKAAYVHVLSDLLGNIGVILAGGIIWLTGWNIVDPILTILFTLLIIFSSGRMLFEAVHILMQGAPRHINPAEITDMLMSLPSVQDIHDLHLWTITSGRVALSAHIVAREPQEVIRQAHQRLESEFHINHSTLQVELPEEVDSKHCHD